MVPDSIQCFMCRLFRYIEGCGLYTCKYADCRRYIHVQRIHGYVRC